MKKLFRGLITVGMLAGAFGQAESSGQYEPYTVQPGDTLYRIATEHGTTVAEIMRLNGLENPNVLEVGQVLQLEALAAPRLPSPFNELLISPERPIQGQTLTLAVELETPTPLRASFLDWDYELAPTATGARAVIAVPALQEPGVYPLVLTSAEAGVLLTVPVRVTAGDYLREAITLPPSSSDLFQRDLIRDELAYVRSHCRPFDERQRWTGRFRYPLDNPVLTSGFGIRRSYNGGPYSSYHEGLDFRGNSSTPVYAAAPGHVVIAEPLTVRGNAVYIQHGLSVCSGYMHLDRLAVREGQEVREGELLGYVGMTGLATGPHLHWEIRVGGLPVDPVQWVEQAVLD